MKLRKASAIVLWYLQLFEVESWFNRSSRYNTNDSSRDKVDNDKSYITTRLLLCQSLDSSHHVCDNSLSWNITIYNRPIIIILPPSHRHPSCAWQTKAASGESRLQKHLLHTAAPVTRISSSSFIVRFPCYVFHIYVGHRLNESEVIKKHTNQWQTHLHQNLWQTGFCQNFNFGRRKTARLWNDDKLFLDHCA